MGQVPFRPTRRMTFVALAAIPVAHAAAAAEIPSATTRVADRRAWDLAEAVYVKAEAAHQAACDRTGSLFEAAETQPLFDIQADACAAASDACDVLVATPAPDLVAVRLKVRISMERDDTFALGFVLVDLDRLMEAAA